MTFAIILAFLRSSLGKTIIGIGMMALVVGLIGVGLHNLQAVAYSNGQKAERGLWEGRLQASEKRARLAEAKNAKAADGASVAVEKVREVTRWRTNTIIKEIDHAVPNDPARPGLSFGFLRLHDAAAVGVSGPAESASEPDGAYSTVTDAQALRVIAENYGTCRFDQDRLTKLQGLLTTWGMAP